VAGVLSLGAIKYITISYRLVQAFEINWGGGNSQTHTQHDCLISILLSVQNNGSKVNIFVFSVRRSNASL
jgi:hypothetical protein